MGKFLLKRYHFEEDILHKGMGRKNAFYQKIEGIFKCKDLIYNGKYSS